MSQNSDLNMELPNITLFESRTDAYAAFRKKCKELYNDGGVYIKRPRGVIIKEISNYKSER